MLTAKNPPKIHTSFAKSEFLIEDLAHQDIVTSWSFLKSTDEPNEFLIRGQSSQERIDIFFHPFLFDSILPDPYTHGDDIDIATVSVIAHEAGHILDKTPAKYEAGKIKEPDFRTAPKEKRLLILDVEKKAWSIGELLLMTCCCRSKEFDQDFNWYLFQDLKAHCIGTYVQGLNL